VEPLASAPTAAPPAAAEDRDPPAVPDPPSPSPFFDRLRGCKPEERLSLVQAEVEVVVRAVMGLDSDLKLNPEQRLDELGLESLLALDLNAALMRRFDVPLASTFAMDSKTVAAMARFLCEALLSTATDPELPGASDA
jgi:acyl carrier protein